MTVEILPIEHDAIEEVWPLVKVHLERYCNLPTNRDTVEFYWQQLIAGNSQLWVIWDTNKRKIQAALVTKITVAPNGDKLAVIDMIEGRGRDKWVHLLKNIEDWATGEGCVSLFIPVRKNWMRYLKDYLVQRYLIEKKLDVPKDKNLPVDLKDQENGYI